MANIQVDEAFAPFSADGDIFGYISVADNSKFYVNAFAWIYSTTQPMRLVKIIDKPDANRLGLFFYETPHLPSYLIKNSIAAYTVADQSYIDMYLQIVDVPDSVIAAGAGPTGLAGGDLYLTYPNPRVGGFRGLPINTIPPMIGQSYVWDGTYWTASTPPGGPPTGAASGDLGANYPNPTVVGLQTRPISTTAPTSDQVLAWNAGTSQWTPKTLNSSVPIGLKTVIWVDFASTALTPDGSVNFPFDRMSTAMAYIASLPTDDWQINVSPGTGTHISDNFIIPPSRSIVIQGAGRTTPTLGVVTMKPSVSGNVTAFFRNINVTGFLFLDLLAGPGTINLYTENVSIGSSGINQAGSSTAEWVHSAGNSYALSSSSPIGSNFCQGDVKVNGSIRADSMQFLGTDTTNITANQVTMQNCSFASNFFISGTSMDFTNCRWLIDDGTITFTGTAGLIKLDSYTTKSYRFQAPSLTNGQVVDYIELNQPDLSFVTVPTLPGQIYAYVGDRTIDLAIADTADHCKAIAGLWNNEPSSLAVSRGIPYFARFEPGLGTITGGQTVYVSLTYPGLGTTTEPSVTGQLIKPIGYVANGGFYNTLDPTGSTALIILEPQKLSTVP